MRPDITDKEERLLLAKVVQVSVKLILANHAYRWKGDIWLQTKGVSTGLRLSGVIERICMDHWRREMKIIMMEHRMTAYILEKYIDDVEVVTENLAPGSRWNGSELTVLPEDIEADVKTNRSLDDITMDAWRGMASGIMDGIDFTVDYCSKNPTRTVAMLDFQLWKENETDPDSPGGMRETLKYAFYEKEMTNPKVMDAETALPHKVKIATLTQEGVRRICNSSRSLPNSQKCKILSNYMRKLQISGYKQRTRANILEGAINTYRKKERAETLGIQPVHRLGTHNVDQRRREKLTGKTEWFRPSKTNWKTKLAKREEELRSRQAQDSHHPPSPQG